MIGLAFGTYDGESEKRSPLEQVFEGLFRVKEDVSMVLGGQKREINKGNIFTVQSLQTTLELIGNLMPIDPDVAKAVKDTTDKFLRILPIDSYVVKMTDPWRITEAEAKKIMHISEKIAFPPEASTMFDLIDILQDKRSGE